MSEPITTEQEWTEAAAPVIRAATYDEETVARALWKPLVEPLVTQAQEAERDANAWRDAARAEQARAQEAGDEIERWENWSNHLTDLLPNMRDGDESQESLIEYAIRDLVERAQAVRDLHKPDRRPLPGRGLRIPAHCECDHAVWPCPTIRALDGGDVVPLHAPWPWPPEQSVTRTAEDADAAREVEVLRRRVRRVRALPRQPEIGPQSVGYNLALDTVLRALDGDYERTQG